MTAAAWKRSVLPLLDAPEGWAFKGKSVYQTPPRWVLRGVLAEGSQTRDALYVWVLSMPLFVPRDHIVLSHSTRLPGRQHLADPAALSQALTDALRAAPSEEAALRQLAANGRETGPYASLLLGDTEDALAGLSPDCAPGDDRPFVAEARLRRERVKSLLEGSGPDAAVGQLREWRAYTLAALGIG